MDTTFLKGLTVLEALALSDEPRGVSELARELDLTKSNVHRLLQALVARGYAAKDSRTSRYTLTLRLWELGSLVMSRVDIKRVAAPFLQELARQTCESIHLSILSDGEVVYIDKIDSPQPVRAYSQVGGRAPAFSVATGKALLAFQPDDVVERLASRIVRMTPRTVRSLDELRKELSRVHQLGYAINRGEWRDGVCGVAAPVRDASRSVIAAIGVSGPAARLTPGKMRDYGLLSVQTAAAISRALGYSPAQQPTLETV